MPDDKTNIGHALAGIDQSLEAILSFLREENERREAAGAAGTEVTVIGDTFPREHELSGYRDRLWLPAASILAITTGDGRAHVCLPSGHSIRVDESPESLATRLGWARPTPPGF